MFLQVAWCAEGSSPLCLTTTSTPSSLCPRLKPGSTEVGPTLRAWLMTTFKVSTVMMRIHWTPESCKRGKSQPLTGNWWNARSWLIIISQTVRKLKPNSESVSVMRLNLFLQKHSWHRDLRWRSKGVFSEFQLTALLFHIPLVASFLATACSYFQHQSANWHSSQLAGEQSEGRYIGPVHEQKYSDFFFLRLDLHPCSSVFPLRHRLLKVPLPSVCEVKHLPPVLHRIWTEDIHLQLLEWWNFSQAVYS